MRSWWVGDGGEEDVKKQAANGGCCEELSKQRPYEGGGSSDHPIAVQILKWGGGCAEEVWGGMLTAHVGQVRRERGM